ncbi:MAG: hypothetical protein H6707_15365 [Deltaproteobacteria bacterium]|nr:hypothetical protein [Deltaproteobacteria bacterium]
MLGTVEGVADEANARRRAFALRSDVVQWIASSTSESIRDETHGDVRLRVQSKKTAKYARYWRCPTKHAGKKEQPQAQRPQPPSPSI